MSTDKTSTTTDRREFGHLYLRGATYWIRYSVGGRRYRESSHSGDARQAEKLLARRQAELEIGSFTTPDVKRTTFDALAQIIRDDYALNGRRSSERLECSLKRLTAAFGHTRAAALTLDRLTSYARERLDAGAAPGTVWNELKVLRRAFRLAKRAGRVARIPDFPVFAADRVRTGFFEDADFQAVLAELPARLQPVLLFAYHTGWRIPSEILPLRWIQVDFSAGVVRLEVGTTKNNDGRTFPFAALPALQRVLEGQRAYTRALERQTGQVIPWVFHRDGRPIRYFDKAWKGAISRAAYTERHGLRVVVRPQLLGRVPHDLRRTAVRNLERAGVSRSVAMKLTGHKTEAVYRRYAIAPEQDLREGVAKLAGLERRGTTGAQLLGQAAGKAETA